MAPLWRVSVSWVGPEPQAAKEPHWLQVHTDLSLRSTVIKLMTPAAGHWTVHWTVSADTAQYPAGRVLPKYFCSISGVAADDLIFRFLYGVQCSPEAEQAFRQRAATF